MQSFSSLDFVVLFTLLRSGATLQQVSKKTRIQNDDDILYFVFYVLFTLRIQNDDGVKLVSREGRLYSHCMNTLGPRCQPSGNYLHFIIVNNIIAFPSNFIISKFIFHFYSLVSLVVPKMEELIFGSIKDPIVRSGPYAFTLLCFCFCYWIVRTYLLSIFYW